MFKLKILLLIIGWAWILSVGGCIQRVAVPEPVVPVVAAPIPIPEPKPEPPPDPLAVLGTDCVEAVVSLDIIPPKVRRVVRYTCPSGVFDVTTVDGEVIDARTIPATETVFIPVNEE